MIRVVMAVVLWFQQRQMDAANARCLATMARLDASTEQARRTVAITRAMQAPTPSGRTH